MAVYIIGNPTVPGGNTFTPTHYVSGLASGSGNGLTRGSPYTFAQAAALATPGRQYLLLDTFTGPPSGDPLRGTFDITVPGTADQPIVWFAENYAALSSSNRTQFRNTGVFPNTSSPVLSIRAAYNKLFGVYVDEAQANPGHDTASLVISGHDIELQYCEFDRRAISNWVPLQTASNMAGVLIQPGQNVRIANNRFLNYTATQTVTYGRTCIFMFSGRGGGDADTSRITVEHNDFVNSDVAIYVKGAGAVRPMRGGMTFRYNRGQLTTLTNVVNNYFLNLGDCDDTFGPNRIYGNLIAGGVMFVRPQFQSDEGGLIPTRSVQIYNNTTIGVLGLADNGWLRSHFQGNRPPASWRVHNNIHTSVAANGGRFYEFPYEGGDASMLSGDHNLVYNLGQLFSDVDTIGNETLEQYRQRTGREANTLTANPLLLSTTYGNANFGVPDPSSPAILQPGVDVFQLLGGSASAPIARGAIVAGLPTPGIQPL